MLYFILFGTTSGRHFISLSCSYLVYIRCNLTADFKLSLDNSFKQPQPCAISTYISNTSKCESLTLWGTLPGRLTFCLVMLNSTELSREEKREQHSWESDHATWYSMQTGFSLIVWLSESWLIWRGPKRVEHAYINMSTLYGYSYETHVSSLC